MTTPSMTPRELALACAAAMIPAIHPDPAKRCTVRRTPAVYLMCERGMSVAEIMAYADRKHAGECGVCGEVRHHG